MIENKFKYICLEKNLQIIMGSIVYESSCSTSLGHKHIIYPSQTEINDIINMYNIKNINENIIKKNMYYDVDINNLCEDTKKYNNINKYKLFMKKYNEPINLNLLKKDYIYYTIHKNTFSKNIFDGNMVGYLQKKIYNVMNKLKSHIEDYLKDTGFIILTDQKIFEDLVINRVENDPYLAYYIYDLFYKNKQGKINNILNLLLLKNYTITHISHKNEIMENLIFYGYFNNNNNDIYTVHLTIKKSKLNFNLFINFMEIYDTDISIGKKYNYYKNNLLKNILLYDCDIKYHITINNIIYENNNIDKYIRYAITTTKIYQSDYIYTEKIKKYYDNNIHPTVENFLIDISSIQLNDMSIVKPEYRYLNNPKYVNSYSLCTTDYIIFPDLKWSNLIEKNIIHKYNYINYKLIDAKSKYSNPYFVAFYMKNDLIKNSNLCNRIKSNINANINKNILKGNNYPHNIKFINKTHINSMKEMYIKTLIFLYEHHNLTYADVNSYVHYQPYLNYGTFHVHFQSLYKKNAYIYLPSLSMIESDTLDKILRSIKITDIIKNISLNNNYYNDYIGVSLSCFRPYQFLDIIDKI